MQQHWQSKACKIRKITLHRGKKKKRGGEKEKKKEEKIYSTKKIRKKGKKGKQTEQYEPEVGVSKIT